MHSVQTISRKGFLNHIPSEIGYYLTGFVDGEGSFNLSLRKGKGYKYGWQIGPSFNVSQKDKTILLLLQKTLNCGRIKTRKDGISSFVVEDLRSLKEKIIPFFDKFSFLSSKSKINFKIFKEAISLMSQKEHLKLEGLEKVLILRENLNIGKGRTRKYSLKDVEILNKRKV
jgi:hypothetical protein